MKLYLDGFSIQLVAIDPVTAVGSSMLHSLERGWTATTLLSVTLAIYIIDRAIVP